MDDMVGVVVVFPCFGNRSINGGIDGDWCFYIHFNTIKWFEDATKVNHKGAYRPVRMRQITG